MRISICAIVRNEGRYIREWLDYHHAIGVNNFYIYDNDSDDNTLDEIRAWEHRDIVTVTPFPGRGRQIEAYEHAVHNFRRDTDWMAFFDVDEFISMQKDVSLHDFLGNIESDTTALFMHYFYFGSNGHEVYSNIPILERFTTRAPNDFYAHHCGKTFARTSAVLGWAGIHIVPTSGLLKNDSGDIIDQRGTGHTDFISHRSIALNHYFTKSKEEWVKRRAYGKADKKPEEEEFFRQESEFHAHDQNAVEDRRALDVYLAYKAKA